MSAVVLVHTASTLAMTGLIWFVQLVHYPLFHYASADDFTAFASAHQRRTTWVVAPLMVLEATTALLLAAGLAPPASRAPALAGLGLLLVIWLSTALIQVPLHRRLLGGYDIHSARRLVRTNWIRTIGWSARSVLVLWLVGR